MPRDLRRMLRGSGRTLDVDVSGRRIAGLLGTLLFLAALPVLAVLTVALDSVGLTILVSVVLSQFLYVILPVHRIRAKAHWLYRGDAGEEAYDEATDYAADAGSSWKWWQ